MKYSRTNIISLEQYQLIRYLRTAHYGNPILNTEIGLYQTKGNIEGRGGTTNLKNENRLYYKHFTQVDCLLTEKIKRIPTHSLKSYKEFIKWSSSAIFYVAGYTVRMEVEKKSDIERNWLLGYEYCKSCKEFKNTNNLEELLKEVDWNKLKISDVPRDVPITLKSLATSAKAAATTRCDNTSIKTFIHSLFDLTKIFLFCNSYAQRTEIVHPKSTKDSGGFEIETMAEFVITDKSSSESESSQIESEYSLRPLPLSEPSSSSFIFGEKTEITKNK